MKILNKIKIQIKSILSNSINHSSLSKLKFLQIIYNSIISNSFINKRGIFYSSVSIFKSQNNVNFLIEKYSKILNCNQNDLKIKSGLKGMIYGKINFISKNGNSIKINGKSIIPDIEEIEEIEHGYERILVIEKDTIFEKVIGYIEGSRLDSGYMEGNGFNNYCMEGNGFNMEDNSGFNMEGNGFNMKDNGLHKLNGPHMNGNRFNNDLNGTHMNDNRLNLEYNCINTIHPNHPTHPNHCLIICGKGYPCKNTIKLLQRLSNTVSNIFCITDFDPYGIHIFLIYKKNINKIIRIGLEMNDLFKNKIDFMQCIKLNERDEKMIEKLKGLCIDNKIKNEIEFMQGLGMKMELEIIMDKIERGYFNEKIWEIIIEYNGCD